MEKCLGLKHADDLVTRCANEADQFFIAHSTLVDGYKIRSKLCHDCWEKWNGYNAFNDWNMEEITQEEYVARSVLEDPEDEMYPNP